MPTCAKCGGEIEAGAAFCSVCGTFASTDSALSQKRISLATFNSSAKAGQARRRLQAAGIAVFDEADGGDNVDDWFAASTTIQIFVHEVDAPRARQLLAESAAPNPPAPDGLESRPAISAEELVSLTPFEILRKLESKLSCLMDEKDVPGWTVNPAYHPDVNAFIEANASFTLFANKARALQQNRAGYFSTMRARQPVAAPKDPFIDAGPEVVPTPLTKPEPAPEPVLTEPPAPGGEATAAAQIPPKRRSRKKALAAAVLLLLPIGLIVGAAFYFRNVGSQHLQEALANVDAQEPDWRWEALTAKRDPLDDEQNSALLVKELTHELPAEWPEAASLREALGYDATDVLSGEQIEALLLELEKHQAALEKMDVLSRLSVGRYPARSLDEVLAEPPPYVTSARALSNLLWLDAALLARGRRADDALLRARCILNIGRSMGDDPDLPAQLYRLESQQRACACIEWALGHGEASADGLKGMQQFLADEQTQPILLQAMRGQRALMHEVMLRLELNGEDLIPARERNQVFTVADRASPVGQAEHWLKVGWIQDNHALNLELLTQAVALARLPIDEQREPAEDLEMAMHRTHDDWRWGLARPALPEVIDAIRANQRSQTELRCAMVALAIERYRLDHNAWPRSLDLLVSGYLTELPLDPYDGKALRFRSFPGGVMIYSVGPDGKDNKGSFDRNDPYLIDRDVGFRLWEVKQRPPPKLVWPPKDEKDELRKKMGER